MLVETSSLEIKASMKKLINIEKVGVNHFTFTIPEFSSLIFEDVIADLPQEVAEAIICAWSRKIAVNLNPDSTPEDPIVVSYELIA